MKTALRRRIAYFIYRQGLGLDQAGRKALEYLIAQTLSPRPIAKPEKSLLDNIPLDFLTNNFNELLLFLAEFPPIYSFEICDIFLSTCSSLEVIKKYINYLVSTSPQNAASAKFLQRLITAVVKDKNHLTLIPYFKEALNDLLKTIAFDKRADFLASLCQKLGGYDLLQYLSKDEQCQYFFIALHSEDVDTFMRGSNFPVKFFEQMLNSSRPLVRQKITAHLNKLQAASLRSVQPDIFDKICQLLQEIEDLHYYLSDQTIAVFQVISWYLRNVKEQDEKTVKRHITGLFFLKIINPIIANYASGLAINIKESDKIKMALLRQLSVVLPKILQAVGGSKKIVNDTDLTAEQITLVNLIVDTDKYKVLIEKLRCAEETLDELLVATREVLASEREQSSFTQKHHHNSNSLTLPPVTSLGILSTKDVQLCLIKSLLRAQLDVYQYKFDEIINGKKIDFVQEVQRSKLNIFTRIFTTELLISGDKEIKPLIEKIDGEIKKLCDGDHIDSHDRHWINAPLSDLKNTRIKSAVKISLRPVELEKQISELKARLAAERKKQETDQVEVRIKLLETVMEKLQAEYHQPPSNSQLMDTTVKVSAEIHALEEKIKVMQDEGKSDEDIEAVRKQISLLRQGAGQLVLAVQPNNEAAAAVSSAEQKRTHKEIWADILELGKQITDLKAQLELQHMKPYLDLLEILKRRQGDQAKLANLYKLIQLRELKNALEKLAEHGAMLSLYEKQANSKHYSSVRVAL